MSILKQLINRLVASVFSRDRIPLDPESLALRDWADLPAHHPVRDRAPC